MKLHKIINNKTKQVELGYEEYKQFYLDNGFTYIEDNLLEQAYDGQWYLQGFAPTKPQATNEEIKTFRVQEYIVNIDPITAEISRLRDEEQTDKNIAEINNLLKLRKNKVEEIKNQYPYNV